MRRNIIWNPWTFGLSLFLMVTLWLPVPVMAQGNTVDDTVEEGKVIDQNMILYGQEVTMDGVVNGDLLAVGEKVTINGEVKGSLFVAGKNVVINGPVAGSVYAAALTMALGQQASIERDVYFIGENLETAEGSAINRDLNVVSLGTNLSGDVNREVNALVGPVNLFRAVYDFMGEQGWLPQTRQLELLVYRDGFKQPSPWRMEFGSSSVQNLVRISSEPALFAGPDFRNLEQSGEIDTESVKDWAFPLLRNLAALLIIGLLGIWLVPTQMIWTGEQARKSPWRAFLTGLAVFILGLALAVLAFLMVLALTAFLYWLSLPNLAFLTGATGMMGLGLALTIFWLSVVYFSKIFIAYLVGRMLFQRFLPKYAHSRIGPLVTGMILYGLLASVPYLDWIVVVIFTLLGLGAIWMVSSSRQLRGNGSTPSVQPAPVMEMGTGLSGPEPVDVSSIASEPISVEQDKLDISMGSSEPQEKPKQGKGHKQG